MTVRIVTAWNGLSPGDLYTYTNEGDTAEQDLIDGGLARDATANDNAGATDLQTQISAISASLPTVDGDYADDAAAEAAGVAVGALYHTEGAVKVRLA